MGIFGRKKRSDAPLFPEGCEPVLRCSICTGEQTLGYMDGVSGQMKELMLIRSPDELDRVCRANGIDPESVRRIY